MAEAKLEGGKSKMGSDELEHYLLERISDYWIEKRELAEKWYKSGKRIYYETRSFCQMF